ncbi:MAG: nucleotide-binding protein [Ignavibacteriae bacterium]|nr:nucleotide-binding protein [Ignavibacteriota bacterium]
MKKIFLFAALCLLFGSLSLYAQVEISSQDAKDHIGETVFVKGTVSGVSQSQKGNIYINFDYPYPDQTFTASVMGGSDVDVSNIKVGSLVKILGEIKKYKEKPEILLKKQDQIISVE